MKNITQRVFLISLISIQIFGMPLLVYAQSSYADQINVDDYDFETDFNSYNSTQYGDYQQSYIDQRHDELVKIQSRRSTVRSLTGTDRTETDDHIDRLVDRTETYKNNPDLANDSAIWGSTLDEDLASLDPSGQNPFAYEPSEQEGFISGDYEEGLSGLYPTKLPNPSNNLADIGVEFTSCVAAVYATQLMKIPIRMVQHSISTIGQVISDMVVGTGMYTFGAGAIAGGSFSQNRTVEDDKKTEETGVTLMGVPVFPSMNSLAFCAKNMLIGYITATVDKWVREGFESAATFVQDLQEDINDITNIAFEEAIGEINLCGHIGFTVRLSALSDALKLAPAAPPNRCTFVFDKRAELMLEGKFFDFDKFESLYMNQNHNAIGGYLAVDSLMTTKRNAYKEKHIIELGWSDGMLPWKDENGMTMTPGQFVMTKIQKTLNTKMDTLSYANEWDEILFIISNQIIKTNLQDAFSG